MIEDIVTKEYFFLLFHIITPQRIYSRKERDWRERLENEGYRYCSAY